MAAIRATDPVRAVGPIAIVFVDRILRGKSYFDRLLAGGTLVKSPPEKCDQVLLRLVPYPGHFLGRGHLFACHLRRQRVAHSCLEIVVVADGLGRR
jgi:hypothetical protein